VTASRTSPRPPSTLPAAIHFDTRWFGDHGIGRFARELYKRMPDTVPLKIAGPKLSPCDPIACTLAARRLREGYYFSPGFNPPLTCPVPLIFTLHDLTHLRLPTESSPLRRLYYRTVVRPATRRAWRILTVSEFSRRDILNWCGVPPERVRVVGNGLSAAFTPLGPVHASDRPYLLHVGRRGSNKNIVGLLTAFARSAARTHANLLFTGNADEPTVLLARTLGIESRLRFTGAVDDAALAALYRGAQALVFPSFYEGFGLPILEAMGCGTPVITARGTATEEVAGEGNALLVDPHDVEAIADAIDGLLSDSNLHRQLSKRGCLRAESFRWEHVGARVQEALADFP
jgi:glycosyltransferase involved in cell wall biosynthesis